MIVRSKAPLRLGLAGGGTDVSPFSDEFGGHVLNATVDMYAYCTIEVTTDNQIIITAADRNESFTIQSTNRLVLDGCLDLHKGVYNRIVEQFHGNNPLSFRMTTYSDAPAGSGLGSSSAMVVAILKAFEEWLYLPLGDYDLARLAFEIERVDVGLAGGKQDQYAATFGGFNFIEFYGNDRIIVNPLRIKNWIINELENSLILYYTSTSRESARIIQEQVKNAREKDAQSIQAMQELKDDALVMKEAILKGDIKKFAQYLDKSWGAKKRTASVITNEYLDRIYKCAIQAGAYAGKVSGAGGGGFMMFMVDPVRRFDVIQALSAFEGRIVGTHFTKSGAQAWKIY